MNKHEKWHSKSAVLVTGGDSGFGEIASKSLLEKGFCVFIGCLKVEEAKKTYSAEMENKNYQDKIHLLQMDITDTAQVNACFEIVKKWLTKNKNYRNFTFHF